MRPASEKLPDGSQSARYDVDRGISVNGRGKPLRYLLGQAHGLSARTAHSLKTELDGGIW